MPKAQARPVPGPAIQGKSNASGAPERALPGDLDDKVLQDRVRALPMGKRLESGFALCRFASQLAGRARRVSSESNPFDPAGIFAAFARREVEYVTVGGFALIAHGVMRATLDVNIVPAPEPDTRERLVLVLADLDAYPDGEPETRIEAKLLSREANMRFQTRHGQLDLLSDSQHASFLRRGRHAGGEAREVTHRVLEVGL